MNPTTPGVKTTEFWLTLFTGTVMLLNGTTIFDVPWDNILIWMGLNGGYIAGRVVTKKGAAPAAQGAPDA